MFNFTVYNMKWKKMRRLHELDCKGRKTDPAFCVKQNEKKMLQTTKIRYNEKEEKVFICTGQKNILFMGSGKGNKEVLMKYLDLTRKIEQGCPVFPGSPNVKLSQAAEMTQDGYRETLLHFGSHTGTHMDAPAHVMQEGRFLDSYPTDRFFGKGIMLDVRGFAKNEISVSHLLLQDEGIKKADYLLFYTGWQQRWGSKEYFEDYPTLSLEAAQYIGEQKKRGIGFDAPSPDPVKSSALPIHHLLLKQDVLLIENLCHLDLLPNTLFTITLLPLLFAYADGAPVRVVALVPECPNDGAFH